MVYDHHKPDLSNQLNAIQHHSPDIVLVCNSRTPRFRQLPGSGDHERQGL
jgi:hypothetical protein